MTDAGNLENRHGRAPAPEAADAPPRAHILALLSDLMAALQLETPVRELRCTLETVPRPGDLAPALAARHPDIVVLDLADAAFPFATTYQTIRDTTTGAYVLAFYPHVRSELGAAAREAGCDAVMARSRFFGSPAAALELALSSLGRPNR